MELFESFEKRCSVRKYTDEKISEDILNKILSAGLSSPSGRNLWPCELIVVRDKAVLAQLSVCKPGSAKMLACADCAVAVLGNEQRSDTWIEDASIVMSNLHLAAAAFGVGSCWVQCRGRKTEDGTDSEAYVRELLGFPKELRLLAILAMGIPADEVKQKDISSIRRDKLHFEKY